MRVGILVSVLAIIPAIAASKYCRCEYNEQLAIHAIKQCNLCTTQFCLDDFGANYNETTDALSVTCFQMESAKEAIIIYLFTVLVLGLLTFGLYKTYIT